MNFKVGIVVLIVFLLIAKTNIAQTHVFSNPQSLNKIVSPEGKTVNYYAAQPFYLHIAPEKEILLAFSFIINPNTGSITSIKGFELFAKNLGACFYKDSLEILFDNGKKLIAPTSNPKLCDQQISGWVSLSKPNLDTLFSSKIKQITYKNGESKETTVLDITEAGEKSYFITLKNIIDSMFPALKD
jgi:hypothetical protein